MLYNIQGDTRWGNDNMGKIGDPMRLWACLITAIANEYDIMPNELNIKIIENKGYAGLQPNCQLNQESNIVWNIVEKLLNFKHVDFAKFIDDINGKIFYIARILHRKYHTGHYVNVLGKVNDKYNLFDTDYNDKLLYDPSKITKFIKIIKG